jgi:hypothetical protein
MCLNGKWVSFSISFKHSITAGHYEVECLYIYLCVWVCVCAFLIPFKLLSSLHEILYCCAVKVASGKVRDTEVFLRSAAMRLSKVPSKLGKKKQ